MDRYRVRLGPLFVSILPLLLISGPLDAQQLRDFRGQASVHSDALAPEAWQSGLQSAELGIGGVAFGGLRFGLFGDVRSRRAFLARGTDLLVRTGIDTTFVLPVESGIAGQSDSVEVVFPEFGGHNAGGHPFDLRDESELLARLSHPLAGGVLAASYEGVRAQRSWRELEQLYNPSGWSGTSTTSHALEANGYFPLERSGDGSFALELDVRHGLATDRAGIPAQSSIVDRRDATLGLFAGELEFAAEPRDLDLDDQVLAGIRTGVLPSSEFVVLPGRYDLASRQSIPGMSTTLRLNPYALASGLPIAGFGSGDGLQAPAGFDWQQVEQSGVAAALDWQNGTAHWLYVGLDYGRARVEGMRHPLFSGTPRAFSAEPSRAGAFVSSRWDAAPFAIEAGMRYDRIDPGGEHPRVPGFVLSGLLPDSLLGDAVMLDPRTGPEDDRSARERLRPLQDCGGAETVAQRTRADGTVVCRDNFVPALLQHGWSPHVAASFAVSPAGVARVSFSRATHGPLAPPSFGADPGVGAWSRVMFRNADVSFTAAPRVFGRDVDMPATEIVRASYRHRVGAELVLELSGFRRDLVDPLRVGNVEFTNLWTGGSASIPVIVNGDTETAHGLDVRAEFRAGPLADLSFRYSYVDTELPDSDPLLHLGMPSRRAAGPAVDVEAVRYHELDAYREHTLEGSAAFMTPVDAEGPLSDAGLLASVRLASGVPYLLLVNQGLGIVGPPVPDRVGAAARAADELHENTPWVNRLRVRVHKGFGVGPLRLRGFADWSGALGRNNSQLYLETGAVRNERHREALIATRLSDSSMDGGSEIDGFAVGDCLTTRDLCEVPEWQPAVNAYSLMQAERRFGDRDGFFSVEEQRAAFGAWYDVMHGTERFDRSDRILRLGIEVVF